MHSLRQPQYIPTLGLLDRSLSVPQKAILNCAAQIDRDSIAKSFLQIRRQRFYDLDNRIEIPSQMKMKGNLPWPKGA